jgi:hypothetical protein
MYPSFTITQNVPLVLVLLMNQICKEYMNMNIDNNYFFLDLKWDKANVRCVGYISDTDIHIKKSTLGIQIWNKC